MSVLERIKDAIFALKRAGVIQKNEDIAVRTGYNRSSISEILNGKVPISDKFIRIFCSEYEINLDFISGNSNEIFLKREYGLQKPKNLITSEPGPEYKSEKENYEKEIADKTKRILELEDMVKTLKDTVEALKTNNELIINKYKHLEQAGNKQTTR